MRGRSPEKSGFFRATSAFCAAAALVGCNLSGNAPATPEDVAPTLVKDVVAAIVSSVESQGLPPSEQKAHLARKEALLALTRKAAGVSAPTLYSEAQHYLDTLDADGHSKVVTAQDMAAWTSRTTAADASLESIASARKIAHANVLVLRLPQSTFIETSLWADYAKRARTVIEKEIAQSRPCALVMDLSEQVGGNAWPAIAVMQPLFTPRNNAVAVLRDNKRIPLFQGEEIEKHMPGFAALGTRALVPLGADAIGVVTTSRTASAGEMLTMLLKGEARARVFGTSTAGYTTANTVITLPDGGSLLLSVSRYAVGNLPAIRGKIVPDHAAPFALEDHEASVMRAAKWAVDKSPGCFSGLKT